MAGGANDSGSRARSRSTTSSAGAGRRAELPFGSGAQPHRRSRLGWVLLRDRGARRANFVVERYDPRRRSGRTYPTCDAARGHRGGAVGRRPHRRVRRENLSRAARHRRGGDLQPGARRGAACRPMPAAAWTRWRGARTRCLRHRGRRSTPGFSFSNAIETLDVRYATGARPCSRSRTTSPPAAFRWSRCRSS